MTRKRYPVAVTAGIALSVLVGCSSGSSSTAAKSSKGGLIGVSMRFIAGNSWLSTMSSGAVTAGKAKGYNVEAVDAQGSAVKQIQQMQTFINKGAKAIIIEPVGDRSVSAGIAAAKRAHVPVVVVNDRVSPELAKQVACNVYDDGGATAKLVGERTAEVAATRKKGATQLKLYIQAIFPQELVTQTRENGFMSGWNAYFQAHPGPKTVRVPNNYGNALPDKTLTAMRNVLAGNPDIDVIFNQTDVVNGAVSDALKGAGLIKPDGSSAVIVGGFDGGMNVITDMAKNPKSLVVADGLNQPATQAAFAVEEAIAAAKKTSTGKCAGSPGTRVLPPAIVTPDTATKFISNLQFAGLS